MWYEGGTIEMKHPVLVISKQGEGANRQKLQKLYAFLKSIDGGPRFVQRIQILAY